ncbi:Ig domain-containing protein [Micromonospora tarapacensis]|uniref:Ig domain-containing protein n=1 Tax=Micromonospora tarapacensis TaxID=2835305 RepID=UPI001E2BCB66|nr:Ig domain-containing protein [Micromonospora tarapacensis]
MRALRPITILLVLLVLLLGTVAPASAAAVTFTSGPPPEEATAHEEYPAHTFTVTGDPTIRFALVGGALPAGMSLAPATGRLGGTPAVPGSYTFTVRATATASGDFADQTATVVVLAPTISITSAAPPSPWYAGQPYPAHTFTGSGGTAPYRLSLRSGSLPAGMALSSSGILAGTPTTPGSYGLGIRVTDAHGFHAEADVTVVIAAPAVAITSGEPPRGRVGRAYSFRFTAEGDSDIQFGVAAGSLPPGLVLGPQGRLTGTPRPRAASPSRWA